MKIKTTINFSELIPFSSFWLLFPGFFIYQVLINLSIIPSFIGGYFGIISLFLAPPLIGIFLYNLTKNIKIAGWIDLFFLLLLIYIVLLSIIHYISGELAGNLDLLYWNFSGVLFNLECFIIGKFYNFNNIRHSNNLLLTYIFILILFILNVQDGIYTLLNTDVEGAVSYQGYARSIVAISFFILAASFTSKRIFYFIIFSSIVVLTIVGSRSELILYLGTLISSYYLLNSKNIVGIIYTVITTFICVLLLFLNFDALLDLLKNTRFNDLITYGIYGSSSGATRLEFHLVAWSYIQENIFFGNYGIYVKHFGSIGAYPHNILSAWLNLGFFGFISYILITMNIAFKSLKNSRRNINAVSLLSLFLIIFIVSSFITSKDYLFMFFGLSVGVYSNIYKKRGI